jgi:O-antigen chain-terminating methyltransferase
MKRTIEKLTEARRSKEDDLARSAAKLKAKDAEDSLVRRSIRLKESLVRLEQLAGSLKVLLAQKRPLLGLKHPGVPAEFVGLAAATLKEAATLIDDQARETRAQTAAVLELIKKLPPLMEAKDRELEARASNHVGMIFKSMEWRVDKFAAEYEDVQILMKKFFLIREKLDSLILALEKGKKPSPVDVRAALGPLEDWRYAGFENRFRGSEEDIRKQQSGYADAFRKGGKVLDLGCGRGEFLDLLRENGIEGEGVDLNGQMIDICLDKGLNCRQGDILDRLTQVPDGSLDGIFSSQVVEHLRPAYLKKLVETAHAKLALGGTIVLETVNPASVFALVQIYYLDLSHEKPVHPRALQFMLESTGFSDVEVRYSAPLDAERLRELPGADERTSVMNENLDRLNDLLFAPPNYAVLGKKR